jgi:site-specific DNA-methyltransferase (adenine-specific)
MTATNPLGRKHLAQNKIGQIMTYQLHNQNCLDWMNTQPEKSVDIVLTSPPYDNIRNYNGYSFDFESVAQELVRLLKPNGVIIWNVADATVKGSKTGTSMRQALYFMNIGLKLHDTMIYLKKNPMPTNKITKRYHQAWEYIFVFSKGVPKTFTPIMVETKFKGQANMKYRGADGSIKYKKTPRNDKTKIRNVFEYTIGGGHTTKDKSAFQHPALMPQQLAIDMLSTWADKNDIIYDPFAGAGTTMLAAKILGLTSIGTEIDSAYCQLIQDRLK